jgi:hypothetical protein
MLKAEHDGPGTQDKADWLVAMAATDATDRLEAAVASAVQRIEAAVPAAAEPRRQIVGEVIWSPLRAVGTFTLAALLVVLIAAYVTRFSAAHVSQIVEVTVAVIVGIAGTTLFYELVDRR